MSIYDVRLALNLSQGDIAKATGLDQRTVSRWESGESRISEDRAQQIAKALDIPSYLITEKWPEEIATVGDFYYWLVKSIQLGVLNFTGERDYNGRIKKGTLTLMGVPFPDPPMVDEFLDWEAAYTSGEYIAFKKAVSLFILKDPLYYNRPATGCAKSQTLDTTETDY